MEKPIALVTGASRGLGLATSEALAQRGHFVIMTGRDLKSLENIENEFQRKGLDVVARPLDLHSGEQIQKVVEESISQFNRIDILVNNAGIFLDASGENEASLELIPIALEESFSINSFAPFYLMQRVLPYMREQNYGRIVNVSSGMGALTDMGGGWPAYRASKTTLNAFTKIMAEEMKAFNIKINAVCPGWVRTDMGGNNASRSVEEGIQGILWAATLDDRGPTGGFFRDGKPISW